MQLSGAGESLQVYAERWLALEDEARQVLSGGRDGGCLRIGSMESTAASRLPALLARYHTSHPGTRLELHTAPSRQLLEQVQAGRLDCAFLALPQALADADALGEMRLASTLAWKEDLHLLLPAHEAGARRPSELRTRSLAAFPPGCTYRGIAEALLGTARSAEWRIQELASYHAMVACVAAGACVALLPASVLALAAPPAELKTLPAGSADTLLVWRSGYDLPAFRRFRECLDEGRG